MTELEKMYDKAFQFKNENKFDEAIKIFKKIIENYGNEKNAINMIAMIYYYEKEDVENAFSYAKKAVELSPSNELSSICLVHCLFYKGYHDDVEKEIKRYVATGGEIKNYNILFEENNLKLEDYISN